MTTLKQQQQITTIKMKMTNSKVILITNMQA